jgi:hypothetical protein
MAWPDLGRAWIVAWALEPRRDLRTIGNELEAAAAASSEDEALTPLENALWRLGAAREKFYAVVALAFGGPVASGREGQETDHPLPSRQRGMPKEVA